MKWYTNISQGNIVIQSLLDHAGNPLILRPGESVNLGSPSWPKDRVEHHIGRLDRYVQNGELAFSTQKSRKAASKLASSRTRGPRSRRTEETTPEEG